MSTLSAARPPASADREALAKIEAGAVVAVPELRPNFPDEAEHAALYLGMALTAKVRAFPAPQAVLSRLLTLGWLRGVALHKGMYSGIAFMDWGRATRSGALAGGQAEAFSARVLQRQFAARETQRQLDELAPTT